MRSKPHIWLLLRIWQRCNSKVAPPSYAFLAVWSIEILQTEETSQPETCLLGRGREWYGGLGGLSLTSIFYFTLLFTLFSFYVIFYFSNVFLHSYHTWKDIRFAKIVYLRFLTNVYVSWRPKSEKSFFNSAWMSVDTVVYEHDNYWKNDQIEPVSSGERESELWVRRSLANV